MADLINELEDRKRQVRHYLAIVIKAERETEKQHRVTRQQQNRLLTLRSGLFLILYNLVEASVRTSIEAIHDRIIRDQVRFENLNEGLRKEVLRLFRLDTTSKLYQDAQAFPSALVAAALNQEFKVGGNVDAKFIRDLGVVYGFSTSTDSNLTWGGADLLTIKSNRNDLAHGRKTYEEVGRAYSIQDLMDIHRRSMRFVTLITQNVENYISSRSYL